MLNFTSPGSNIFPVAVSSPDALRWLLEPSDAGVRYLALRDLTDCSSKNLISAASEGAHCAGPIAEVLRNMHPEGYWVKPGAGYSPKYTSTIWSVILLAQLGASMESDKRIATACDYLLDHCLSPDGRFTFNGQPAMTADCLQGNLSWSLVSLGCKDPRLDNAFEWMARSVTGEGVAPASEKTAGLRYTASKCGPGFACGSNNKLPCAWGSVKVMLAFSILPEDKKTRLIKDAITEGVNFLFSKDPARADYPCGYALEPSGNWWKFGFPVFYVSDILQNAEALVNLGHGQDLRLANALELIRGKQDKMGRWQMEYDYTGKTWVDFGPKKQPNKWVTLRALRVLKKANQVS